MGHPGMLEIATNPLQDEFVDHCTTVKTLFIIIIDRRFLQRYCFENETKIM